MANEEAAPEELVTACRRLYKAIEKLDAKAAALVGVSRNDLRCLNLIAEAPAKPGKIGSELNLTSGAVTTLLDRLERAGLAERRRDPNDRRGVLVVPTAHLFETLGPLYQGVAKGIEQIAEAYGPEERKAAVRHLTDACSAYEAAL
ncbi:MAG: MarR family transcriptional regulator [Pseudomonadota bacterium]